ncbi:hypothetical protein MMC14_003486 [Varicellaria rhodocarpa]|nr:hypothetical protein [Varicellaria rhodocarpa]
MPSKTTERGQDRDARVKERPRHKSSRSKRKSSSKERAYESGMPERSSTLADSSTKRRSSMPVPELSRRASSTSFNGSKASLPYPSFSKAHSREAVASKESIADSKHNPYTPDPTDIQKRAGDDGDKPRTTANVTTANGPPSPPLTAVDQAAVVEDKRRDLQKVADEMRKKFARDREVRDGKTRSSDSLRPTSQRSSPWRSSRLADRSEVSSSQRSKPTTPTKMKPKPVSLEDGSSLGKSKSPSSSTISSSRTDTETLTESTLDSDSTSIAPQQPKMQQPFTPDADDESSPITDPDSSPKTPTPRGTPFPTGRNGTPAYMTTDGLGSALGNEYSPMPPPPPPPPSMPFQVPRVDYLVQHGGLFQPVPKTFLFAPNPVNMPQGPIDPAQVPNLISTQVQKFFAPFNGLLEDYTKVMSKNGSLAVATGYRSIARRLLDRLEAVFARDISSETCECSMCRLVFHDSSSLEDERGISWGEILEYVCGRQELPQWPVFILETAPIGLGISATEHRLPMQKLDIDVPEEYREHYIRQSKKTKQSVDRWLGSQPHNPTSPPQDVDDDTLTFAMLTHLEPEQRPVFTALLGIASSQPASRASTPLNAPKPLVLKNTGLAIQRLYRLSIPPRSPECAIFLLKNPSLHNVLATLAAVSDGEWEILTSGRFDGFLRSGADDTYPPSRGASRGPIPVTGGRVSRGAGSRSISSTPFSASAGAPVAMDEETEIAVLAEVERDIFLGMEALEDAFEALHCKAEIVRQRLRERGAGLSMASQARRGGADSLDARLGTPASGTGLRGWDSETDDGIDDGMSELAPDDSASNISSSRHRRPKRRNERRTPAPVEEEDEASSEVPGKMSRRRG